jgi:hypothetical protein
MEDRISAYRFLVGKPEKDVMEQLCVYGRLYQNGSPRSGMGKHGLDWSGSG